MHVDDIKLAGKKRHLDLMWKVLNEQVDLEQPTSFFDHVYFGCTQCEENTLTLHFLVFAHMFHSVARDIGARCSARHVIHVSYGCAI